MKTWIVSSLDEETIQGEETIWGNTVNKKKILYKMSLLLISIQW